jgi:flavin-dependent dehydrogenase
MVDAIVVGAGPAGSVATLTMARAGARVLIVDYATFPRDTLCGGVIGAAVFRELDNLGLARPQPDGVIHLRGCGSARRALEHMCSRRVRLATAP